MPVSLDVLGEKEGTHVERNAFWHIAHYKAHIICDRSVVSLKCPLPVYALDVPLSWIEVVFNSEVFV